MAKKQAKPEEPAGESAPMWIVSFADLVTLMMSFFVVLYALKQGGAEQQMVTTAAIKAQFGYDPPDDSTDPLDMMVMQIRGRGPNFDKNAGRSDVAARGADGKDPEVTTIRQGKQITSGSFITFTAGSTQLDAESMKNLRKIADLLKGYNNVLLVKGHVSADELPLRPDDLNGMSLSYQRASVVMDELKKLGIDGRVLRPVACGPFEPLKLQAYNEDTQRLNRRVEVFSTESTASDYFPETTVPPATRLEGETTTSPATAPAQ